MKFHSIHVLFPPAEPPTSWPTFTIGYPQVTPLSSSEVQFTVMLDSPGWVHIGVKETPLAATPSPAQLMRGQDSGDNFVPAGWHSS